DTLALTRLLSATKDGGRPSYIISLWLSDRSSALGNLSSSIPTRVCALARRERSGVGLKAGTRAFKAGLLASRLARKLVGIRCAKIDLLTLHGLVCLLLNIEYRLGTSRRHVSIWTEDG